MTPVIFWAEVAPTAHALQFGDAARIEIWSKPTNADRGAAMALLALKQKRLRLRFYVGTDTTEPVAEFGAALAQINSSLVFTRERAKVKFDVPDTELFNAAKLIGYDDRALRLEILMDGDGALAEKARKERGPHGAYWQHLFGQCQIQHNPDLLAKLQLEPTATTEMVKLALRDRFNVQSLSFVGPEQAEDFAQRIGVNWPRWNGGERRAHD